MPSLFIVPFGLNLPESVLQGRKREYTTVRAPCRLCGCISFVTTCLYQPLPSKFLLLSPFTLLSQSSLSAPSISLSLVSAPRFNVISISYHGEKESPG